MQTYNIIYYTDKVISDNNSNIICVYDRVIVVVMTVKRTRRLQFSTYYTRILRKNIFTYLL